MTISVKYIEKIDEQKSNNRSTKNLYPFYITVAGSTIQLTDEAFSTLEKEVIAARKSQVEFEEIKSILTGKQQAMLGLAEYS